MAACPTHSNTVPASSPETSSVEWYLPRHVRSVGRSRKLLRLQARSWGLADDTTETAVLLLSELVTNACQHARVPPGRQIGTRCVLHDRTLRIEVSDASADLPQPRRAEPDDESGRGLALVTTLADAWGAHPRPHGIGKTVWFELNLPADRLPPDVHQATGAPRTARA